MKKDLFKRLLYSISALAAAALVTGCESEDERKLAAAQACLDSAPNTTNTTTLSTHATGCVSLVSGLISEQAYLIRCSAHFVAQGFTASRMANAFQQVKNNTGGNDPMVSLMGYFVFQSTTGHTATDTINDCSASGVRSMSRLATAAQLATTLATYGGLAMTTFDPSDPGFNPNAMLTAIQNIDAGNSQAAEIAIGQVAVNATSSYCNEGSSYASTEVCTNLNAAIAGAGSGGAINYELVGEQLLAALQANSGH